MFKTVSGILISNIRGIAQWVKGVKVESDGCQFSPYLGTQPRYKTSGDLRVEHG